MQTLSKIIILLLLYSVQLSAQVTFPDPATIPTKEWVLEQIRLSKDSTITPTPIPDPKPDLVKCKEGPDIVRISAITSTGAVFQFHGVQVVELKWEIVGTAFSGTIKPTSNQIGIGYNLPAGTYTLRLQGVSCSGVSTKSFTVPEQSGGGGVIPVPVPDPVPDKPVGDLPKPAFGADQAFSPNQNWQLRYITGKRSGYSIDASGKITDIHSDQYQGGKRYATLYGEKYNIYYLLQGHPIEDIKGLKLDPGLYYFQKLYVKASRFKDWESIQKEQWNLTTDDGIMPEVSNTEILVINGSDVGSQHTFLQPTFHPKLFSAGYKLSPNKITGFKNQYTVSDNAFYTSGVTHLLDTGGGHPIPPENKFTLAKLESAGGDAAASEDAFRQYGYNYAIQTGVNKKLILTGEIGEQIDNYKGSPKPAKLPRTNAFYEGYLQAFKDRYPGTKVSDLYLFGEYGGVGNQGEPNRIYGKPEQIAAYRETMSSLQQARRAFEPSFSRFSTTDQSTYFSLGKYPIHNVLIRVYFWSLSDVGGGYFPNLLYTFEKMYLAAPDRKQFVFTWDKIQDMMGKPYLDVASGWSYKWSNPNGKFYVGFNPLGVIPPYIAYGVGIFSQIFTEGFGVWSDSSGFSDVPVEQHSKGLVSTGGIKSWKPEGKEWEDWGKIGQPSISDKGGFSKYPLTAIDAFYAGAADYAQIESRLNKAKYWVKHSKDGGKTWYTPNAGTRGLEVSDFQKPNYNPKNPILDISAEKLPIVIFGEGDAGDVVIYYNTYKLPTDSDNVVIEHKGKTYNIGQLQGSKIHTIPL